jgi:CheY-like chemotaxis protein
MSVVGTFFSKARSMSALTQTKLNVLLADDDPVFRSLVQSRLMRLDCCLHEAADGSEAWRVVRTHNCDLALVDFEMPGLDGIGLTRCLRTHPQTRHIPIVMCTSRTDGPAILAALEAGVSSFMTKPINWSLFERHLAHLLRISEATAQVTATLEALRASSEEKYAVFRRLTATLQPLLQRASVDSELKPVAVEAARLLSEYERLVASTQTEAANIDAHPGSNFLTA